MSKDYGTKDKYSGDWKPPQTPSPGDEASARKIIADYLDQVKARLPAELATEVIPELRSHLMEKASQPSGRLTGRAAWDAVVSMGSPDIVAREFRRESEAQDTERFQSFLLALTPQYRQWFWWIIIGIVIADLVVIAYVVSMSLLNVAAGWSVILPFIMLGLTAQIWVFAGIAISYLVMLLLSHPEGAPLTELLRNIMQSHEKKEERVPRTQRRVQKRVNKFEQLTGRSHLMAKLFGHVVGVAVAVIFAIILPIWIPTYPTFDLQVLYWLAIIGLTQAGLTSIRILVGRDSLAAQRLLASIDVLYGLVGVWMISLFFFGPLSFPFPWYNPDLGVWTLFHWKAYVMIVAWVGPLLVLLVFVGMVIQLIQVNIYIQPLYNGYTVSIEEIE